MTGIFGNFFQPQCWVQSFSGTAVLRYHMSLSWLVCQAVQIVFIVGRRAVLICCQCFCPTTPSMCRPTLWPSTAPCETCSTASRTWAAHPQYACTPLPMRWVHSARTLKQAATPVHVSWSTLVSKCWRPNAHAYEMYRYSFTRFPYRKLPSVHIHDADKLFFFSMFCVGCGRLCSGRRAVRAGNSLSQRWRRRRFRRVHDPWTSLAAARSRQTLHRPRYRTVISILITKWTLCLTFYSNIVCVNTLNFRKAKAKYVYVHNVCVVCVWGCVFMCACT